MLRIAGCRDTAWGRTRRGDINKRGTKRGSRRGTPSGAEVEAIQDL